MSTLKVDLALVEKYNVPGPRYTSYPPATQFHDRIQWAELEPLIEASQQDDANLSLYYHIPFCQTLCWYCGCTTVITTQHSQSQEYLRYLKREMELMAPRINPKRKVAQLHFGGGSPTFLSPQEIRELGGYIHDHFQFAPDIEASVEIDPRRMTPDHVTALREAGFNRASIGVQDFNPKVQEAVHRIQPRQETESVIQWVREAGFKSINVDLIYGLPFQTLETFENTLDQILEINPDRLAVFSYAHVPWIKPAQKILEDALPSPGTKLQILKRIIEKLTHEGRYVYVGMDHFARPDDELTLAQKNKTLQRNFQGYSTRGGADIHSFGMSSISQAAGAYWQNQKELKAYYAAIDQSRIPLAKGYVLTPEDKLRRLTIMRLMCDLSLDYAAMSRMLGIDFAKHFEAELASLDDLEQDELLTRDDSRLKVTETGRLFIRNIAMRFDAYLPSVKERRFSRTI
jgi:oxygen-independent coproporphyrinogen-3 oxidase